MIKKAPFQTSLLLDWASLLKNCQQMSEINKLR